MRVKRNTKVGTATTTTHAPSTNFDTRKMMVASAVTTAPRPLMVARLAHRGGRVRNQWTTNPVWERVKPVNTPMAKRGISSLVFPPTAIRSPAERPANTQMPFTNTWRSPRNAKEMGEIIVSCQQAGEDRQSAERGVCRQREDDGDGEGNDVIRPMPTHRFAHDLAEYGLVGSWSDVPASGQDRQAQQHEPQDHPEQEFGTPGPDHPGFFEEGHAVGDCLDPGERAAPRGERLEDQQQADDLQTVSTQERMTGLWNIEGQRVDQADRHKTGR